MEEILYGNLDQWKVRLTQFISGNLNAKELKLFFIEEITDFELEIKNMFKNNILKEIQDTLITHKDVQYRELLKEHLQTLAFLKTITELEQNQHGIENPN